AMFDVMMEWMAIPLLFGEHGDPPKRMGLTHFSVAPYGVFQTRDRQPILISVQNDREWAVFCSKVLGRPELGKDPRFATNSARIANRTDTDGLIGQYFGTQDVESLSRQLDAAQIAFARVNDVVSMLRHPHFRRVVVNSPNGSIALP